jgi:hypothetical protein
MSPVHLRLASAPAAGSALTRIMHSLGQLKGENEQKAMGPQDFRGSALAVRP